MRKVLIVEDEKLIVKILEKFVEKTVDDSSVEVVSTGAEVLSSIQGNSKVFDLVILDYHLPDMSCEKIIKALKEKEHNTKIVLSTGEIASKLSNKVGADSFLQKPFTFDEFQSIVNKLGF